MEWSTELIKVDPERPEGDIIRHAAAVIQRGGMVAFPTETVYGLGANALNENAVARIFAAKGRPATNPLIVHVTGIEQAQTLVDYWSQEAQLLAERFWPGPLTLVLPRNRGVVPDIVTAGGPTVAVRSPAHKVAMALLLECGLPIAAPSANRSTRVSPTTAEHVLAGLKGRIDLILDSGPTSGGIESTVLNLAVSPPRLLRPGLVTPAQIEEIIGPIERTVQSTGNAPATSPGMLERHYSPRATLLLIDDNGKARTAELLAEGKRVGSIPLSTESDCEGNGLFVRPLPPDAAAYAARIYSTLHELDAKGVDTIIVQIPPDNEEWLAVRDRLHRASGRKDG